MHGGGEAFLFKKREKSKFTQIYYKDHILGVFDVLDNYLFQAHWGANSVLSTWGKCLPNRKPETFLPFTLKLEKLESIPDWIKIYQQILLIIAHK